MVRLSLVGEHLSKPHQPSSKEVKKLEDIQYGVLDFFSSSSFILFA
jgi:hypothetical protein